MTFETSDEDKFMVLASDGVWEFLSNAEVVDLVVPFWHKNDLKGACSTVVKESVLAWEREEDSIDDITCIIVFFKRSGPVTDYTQLRVGEGARKASTRDNSLNNYNNGGGAGEGRLSKHYQHKGRHLKKSKEATISSK